jgi:hypothetical protein
MYKRRLETSQIAYAIVSTTLKRDELIKRLHARGVTTIGNRLVEDVIKVSGYSLPDNWDDIDLGQETANEIKLSDVIAGVSPTAPAASPEGVPVAVAP